MYTHSAKLAIDKMYLLWYNTYQMKINSRLEGGENICQEEIELAPTEWGP